MKGSTYKSFPGYCEFVDRVNNCKEGITLKLTLDN